MTPSVLMWLRSADPQLDGFDQPDKSTVARYSPRFRRAGRRWVVEESVLAVVKHEVLRTRGQGHDGHENARGWLWVDGWTLRSTVAAAQTYNSSRVRLPAFSITWRGGSHHPELLPTQVTPAGWELTGEQLQEANGGKEHGGHQRDHDPLPVLVPR